MTSNCSTSREPGDIFATTHWTVVLAAGKSSSPDAQRALEELCHTYWFPLYAYVRRRGHGREDAEDLTQTFFTKLLDKNSFAGLDGEKGKFRAWLLAALKHFLANERDKARAQKRGGGEAHLSLDWETADSKFQVADDKGSNPEKNFDREWALALLARVIQRLQKECEAEGRARLFEQLKNFLTAGKGDSAYAEIAGALGMEEGAVRVAVHRLRKRYRQLLRDEITNTLSDAAMVDEEMRALFGAFG
ncbi:MAG TPA: sigma-70 family RNA polymerase sigma factor [Candidatus Sulfotelmatobacter sp.]|jgi:RNA polymerase sigma factor (sigma-70 family)|nr:sigma-70 family RNA polymerase sigma factor [Candidatus Sulfotelmatobacter sp.]